MTDLIIEAPTLRVARGLYSASYVSARDEGPARIDLEGRRYIFHVQ